MKLINKILDYYPEDEFLIADGFDNAIIGVDTSSMRLVYSVSKCVIILMKDDMSEDDALDYFFFNVEGSYVGEKTPIWCYDFFDKDLKEKRLEKLQKLNSI